MTPITWVLDGISFIATGVAWGYAIKARRCVRKIREINGGGPR